MIEAAHVGQFGGEAVTIAHEGGEHASGLDRAELTLVADQDDLCPRCRGGAHELVESEGPGEGCLVDDHQLVCSEAPTGQLGFGVADALAQWGPGTRDVGKGSERGDGVSDLA